MSNTNFSYLLLVESPAKCSKIEQYLGPNYKCMASYGHITELDGLKSIDTTKDYKLNFTVIKKRLVQLNKIKTAIKNRRCEVIIATDDDREGEAIGWHLCQFLKLPVSTTKRIIFHEITKPALQAAVAAPTVLNQNIINAQNARQTLDILVGYNISPILWKNISRQSASALSAGRCQTPTLRLVYDNYLKIKKNPGEFVYKTSGFFTKKNIEFILQTELKEKQDAIDFLEKSRNITENGGTYIYIRDNIKEKKVKPPQPLITSTLQQEANNLFNMSTKETMKHAQTLYEKGFITYMRTDSKKYSAEFINASKSYIKEKWGMEYIGETLENITIFAKTDNSNKKEDSKKEDSKKEDSKKDKDNKDTPHEAIRPTKITVEQIPDHYPPRVKNLYKMIYSRTIESMMADLILSVITASINLQSTVDNKKDSSEIRYKTQVETIVKKGWTIVRNKYKTHITNYNYLMKLKDNSEVVNNEIRCEQTLKNSVKHLSESCLVQTLEKRGIGRPSTFASLISKIIDRKYVAKTNIEGRKITCSNYELINGEITENEIEKQFNSEKNKLVIQPLGILVIEFLLEYFTELFDYEFTSRMEQKLDNIVANTSTYLEVCSDSHKKITDLLQGITKDSRQEFQIDDKHFYMIGKYGPVIKKKVKNDKGEDKITFLTAKPDIDIDKLRNNEYALSDILVNNTNIYNKNLGEYNNNKIILKKGKYGNYIEVIDNDKNKKTFSIKDINKDFNEITIDDVKSTVDGKKVNNKNCLRIINEDISIRTGKYGPYVYYKTKKMNKPVFVSLKKFKFNYLVCDPELIIELL